jgi:hypothetical protein
MTTLEQIAEKIVKEQELIIGPVAWQEAEKVSGLHFAPTHESISIDGANSGQVIDKLVEQYEHFFGRAAREACKDAARSLIADLPPAEVPVSLR